MVQFVVMGKSYKNLNPTFVVQVGMFLKLFGDHTGILYLIWIKMVSLKDEWRNVLTVNTKIVRQRVGHIRVNISLVNILSCVKWYPQCQMMIFGDLIAEGTILTRFMQHTLLQLHIKVSRPLF